MTKRTENANETEINVHNSAHQHNRHAGRRDESSAESDEKLKEVGFIASIVSSSSQRRMTCSYGLSMKMCMFHCHLQNANTGILATTV